jgi:soluble calcium-activated nucleotidase 1
MGCGGSTAKKGAAPPTDPALLESPKQSAAEKVEAAPDSPGAAAPEAPSALPEGEIPENSCKHLLTKMKATEPAWAAMMAQEKCPEVDATFKLMFIADQDEASRIDADQPWTTKWETRLGAGVLTYHGAKGDASYSLTCGPENVLFTTRGDKSGRGAEYSALELFDGRLLTMCDRTGNCDEIFITEEGTLDIQPLRDSSGNEVRFLLGDGKKDKALKVEWATQKDGKLFVGSTGKERTDDDGNVVHEGEMWCKWLSPETYEIEHVDTRGMYNTLRKAAVCEHGAGYMIHEGGRWSDVHGKWLFMPRKLSRELYDEVKDASKCVNLMLSLPSAAAEDGSDVAMQEYLDFLALRGCSDFIYVPGTNDCHVFVTRTEETLEGDLSTYASVVDLQGNVLMAEFKFGIERKFEGVSVVNDSLWEAATKTQAAA